MLLYRGMIRRQLRRLEEQQKTQERNCTDRQIEIETPSPRHTISKCSADQRAGDGRNSEDDAKKGCDGISIYLRSRG